MKHKPVRYRGKFRKVFCNCNDSWWRIRLLLSNKRQEDSITCGFPSEPCPDCNRYPWIYISKADEPLQRREV